MNIEYVEIGVNNPRVKDCAQLVSRYSLGFDYPISPLKEFKKLEYIIIALDNNKIIGCANIN